MDNLPISPKSQKQLINYKEIYVLYIKGILAKKVPIHLHEFFSPFPYIIKPVVGLDVNSPISNFIKIHFIILKLLHADRHKE